jgi:hypothetical protein
MKYFSAGVPAEKRENSLNVYMLLKSKAFACTKGENRGSPLCNPHRARFQREPLIFLHYFFVMFFIFCRCWIRTLHHGYFCSQDYFLSSFSSSSLLPMGCTPAGRGVVLKGAGRELSISFRTI